MEAFGPWTFSDAWVLTAVGMADKGDGAPLKEVVNAADALNHAILDPDELERAVRRLVPAGLITIDGLSLSLTDAGRQLFESAPASRWFEQATWLEAQLHRLPEPELAEWELPVPAFMIAVDEYMEDMRRFMSAGQGEGSPRWSQPLPNVAPAWVPVTLLSLTLVSVAGHVIDGIRGWRSIEIPGGLFALTLIFLVPRLRALRSMRRNARGC